MKKLNIILLILAVSASYGHAEESSPSKNNMEFSIYCHSSFGVLMTIENRSYSPININSRFIVATRYLPGVEVYMDIINDTGKKFLYQKTPRVMFPTAQDELTLSPSILVGKILNFEEILNGYKLNSGKYRVVAFYRHINWHEKLRNAEKKGLIIKDISNEKSDATKEKLFNILYPKNDVVLRSNEISITVNNDNSVTCQKELGSDSN